ncbi:MAG: sigma-70 family RNA polymerase sigma factor [Bacteroidia bacterium]
MKPAKEIPEVDLIRRCIQQDTLAQNELYRRFAGKMMGVCMRYARNRTDAQDILQDSFLKVFVNLQSFKGEGSFEGWIKRIVINTSLKHYKKNLKFKSETDIDNAYDLGFDNQVVSHMSAQEMMASVQQMPDGYRTIFNLYAIEGFQHNEIGEMLGISEGTSKSQLSRARNYLIQLLKTNNVSRYES